MSMSNTNRPDDTRCGYDSDGLWLCCPASTGETAGVCRYCGMGSCSGCGDPMTAEQCAESKRRAPETIGDEVYCPACLVQAVADSDGVPVAVDEDKSGAQTVRLKADPSIRETGVEWADKLDAVAI